MTGLLDTTVALYLLGGRLAAPLPSGDYGIARFHQIAALASIRIPLHTKRPIGLDGESFGVHAGNEFAVEWWCDGPPEWKDLINWTRGCFEYFRQFSAA